MKQIQVPAVIGKGKVAEVRRFPSTVKQGEVLAKGKWGRL